MIGTEHRIPRFREALSWSCEVKYGPSGLEELVSKSENDRRISVLQPMGNIGNMLVSAEKRFNAGVQIRLSVRAWASVPVIPELNDELKQKGLYYSRALRRLISMKATEFFKERANAAAQAKASQEESEGKEGEAGTSEGE